MNASPKVLLINPPSNCVNDDRLEPPLGLLYIASTLMENGYTDVSISDMTGCKSEEDIMLKINSIPKADVYGITNFCTNYQYAKMIIEHVRKLNPSAYVVIGGPNPSGAPEFILKDSGVDAVVTGEGEDAFSECVESYASGSKITGIIIGKPRQDIDSYAFPARDLVDFKSYSRKLMDEPVVSLLSSRGCKHHCAHCNSVVMGGGSHNIRYRSAGNIIKEIESLRGRFKNYRFNDDNFTGNPNIEELLVKIKELDIRFRVFARIEDLNERNCQLLKEAGCVHVSIGLESLNPDNLKIIGKASMMGSYGNIMVAKSHGLTVRSSFMVGLPFDTDETVEKYFGAASKLGIDEFAVYPLIPYPGTMIAKNPEIFGYAITNYDFTDYVQMGRNGRTCYALKHENFGVEDVIRWKAMAERILSDGGTKHMIESGVAR
jgi:anaerobic magnesium-protoporphyrin IX monomethyl ester cyclase